jgi:hypothetical protein
MVAVVDRSSSAVVPVALAACEEASGLANMVGQYLEQVLADSSAKRAEAAALRGRLGLHAREGNVAVTIVFADGGVVIEEGLREPNAVIAGEVEFLMHVLAGRANPVWEMGEGRVRVQTGLRHPLFAYQAYHLMRLPDVHVWSGLPRPPAGVLVGAAAATLIVVVWRVRTARARS